MNEILKKTKIEIKQNKISEEGNWHQITIKIPTEYGWIDNVNFILDFDIPKTNYEMKFIKEENEKAIFQTNIYLPTRAIYHYYFTCNINGKQIYIKNSNTDLNDININETFKISVNFDIPEWAKGATMYHVFLDRFNRGSCEKMEEMPRRKIHQTWDEEMIIGPDENGIWNNDFYGGDLKGIIEKLDYLKKLNIDIIYISPIFQSQSNHRYDTADYEKVDIYAGYNEDLKELCNKAHKLNIKIILDAVFNHTGNDSKYFNEYGTYPIVGAYQSQTSPYYSFYKKHEENGQIKYDYWWGMKNLPVCDGTSKEWIDYITGENGIIDKWFELGIDGLRLDVADELNDNFIKLIRKAVKRNKKDGFIIGEVWKNPMRMNREYITSAKSMDTVMNYLLIDALLRYFKYADVDKLKNILNEILTEYPDDTIKTLMNFTSTHDITRIINLLSSQEFQKYGEWAWNLNNNDYNWCKNYKSTEKEYNQGKKLLKPYIFTLTFLPGIISIFYGDEIGIEGMGNLINRKPYPKTNHDKQILEIFKTATTIRKNESFLKNANTTIKTVNEKHFVFERKNQNHKLLVFVSRVEEYQDILVPEEYQEPIKIYSLNNSNKQTLTPYGAIALKK